MTRLIVDAAMREKLRNAKDFVEVCDETGEVLGVFYQMPPAPPPGASRSPFSDEEIQGFRKEKGGRSLAEILKDLGAS
jgi:hypothetical protein